MASNYLLQAMAGVDTATAKRIVGLYNKLEEFWQTTVRRRLGR
jgi:hypothetical protein